MARPRPRAITIILKELQSCVDEQDRELTKLHLQLERALKERDDLAEQLRFAIDQANRETREASSLRAELLARSTAEHERLDFCRQGGHGETTAVLPRRHRVRDDEDTLVSPEPFA